MPRPLSISLPIPIYHDTLLKDITTRPLLPHAVPTEYESFPVNIYPEYVSPYHSLLPQEQMNIDFAKRDKEYHPLDIHHLHNDIGDRVLYLVTYLDTPIPRYRHWSLQWRLERKSLFADTYPAVRVLETTRSVHNYQNPFLINTGPRTTSAVPEGRRAIFPIAKLTLDQRQELEQIAWNVGVVKPDGQFNCQNWVTAVLSVAISRGILEEEVVKKIMNEALEKEPTEYLSSVPLDDEVFTT